MYSYPHKTAYRHLDGISLEDYASCLAGPGHGLYLHLPFCRTKCGYCNLFSVTGLEQDPLQIDRYLEAVRRQSLQYQELLKPYQTGFSEVVIGGGTPLLLTEEQLKKVFELLEMHAPCADDRELVIETAPNETSREKLKILKAAGVTRVSMGIQSFSSEELGTLRRRHSAEKAREALTLLKEYGFLCINVDFIYGIPGQTVDSLLASLKEAVLFAPDEIFLYPLYVKHGAGLEQAVRDGMVLHPEEALLQYREASRVSSFGRFSAGLHEKICPYCADKSICGVWFRRFSGTWMRRTKLPWESSFLQPLCRHETGLHDAASGL